MVVLVQVVNQLLMISPCRQRIKGQNRASPAPNPDKLAGARDRPSHSFVSRFFRSHTYSAGDVRRHLRHRHSADGAVARRRPGARGVGEPIFGWPFPAPIGAGPAAAATPIAAAEPPPPATTTTTTSTRHGRRRFGAAAAAAAARAAAAALAARDATSAAAAADGCGSRWGTGSSGEK